MRLTLLMILAFLGACREFPELDAAVDADARAAPYPELVPIESLRAALPAARADDETERDLKTRAAGLKSRAEGLRGGVVDERTRARMKAGVQ